MKRVCCFAGHSKLNVTDEILKSLTEKIENLIQNENVTEFRVGNYGDFDQASAQVVRELKKKYNITLILVIPYLSSKINNNKEYYEKEFDEILLAQITPNTPKKLGIIKCNEYMVNTSDFLIYYVKNHCTGADRTLAYAQKKKLVTVSV